MSKVGGKKTIIIAGQRVVCSTMSSAKVHAVNKRIGGVMKQASRTYQANAAASQKDISKKVLNA